MPCSYLMIWLLLRAVRQLPCLIKGIASLGGMKQFVKPNQTVVIKPNIGWDSAPERAANTNPELVARIVEQCKRAGAKTVYVFDNTCAEGNPLL